MGFLLLGFFVLFSVTIVAGSKDIFNQSFFRDFEDIEKVLS
jgi:hypothetical protein